MSKNLNILVISYYFPPYQKVGGRRWAKHCKYLNRSGISTFVLAGAFPNSNSSWDKDVVEYEKFVTRITIPEVKTPYYKEKLPVTIFQKTLWKLSLWKSVLKNRYSKKQYKISENTAQLFLNAAIEIIEKQSINTIILSIGPHKYSEVLILLKDRYPTIKYVLDERDDWKGDFIDTLKPDEQILETAFQKKVISQVDLIMTPAMELKRRYESSFTKEVYLLPHCVDLEDIPPYKPFGSASIVKLIYGGAFYKKIENSINLIKKCIDQLSLNKKVAVEFYVSVKGYEKELEHPFIKRYGFIDSQEYFLKVQESNYVILILPPSRAYAMSSKFFELVALRKPILYFGDKGEVSEYLIENRLGYHVTSENLNEITDEILKNIVSESIPDKSYDISSHTFEYQTKLLVTKIKSL